MAHADVGRPFAAMTLALALAAGLGACGDDTSEGSAGPDRASGQQAPGDASTEDFCPLFEEVDDGTRDSVDDVHRLADELAGTGTPEQVDA